VEGDGWQGRTGEPGRIRDVGWRFERRTGRGREGLRRFGPGVKVEGVAWWVERKGAG
jgi:hypothetical protein